MTTIIAEYRYLAQSIASQYGRRHENFTGDGHLFLFESADVAAHFGLKLIAYWKQRRRSLLALHKAPDLPIRVGCHFGECSQLADADDWVGRAINLAKRVEAVAEVDALFITQTILELIDLPFYEFSEAGFHDLKGDFLQRRQLYRLLSVTEEMDCYKKAIQLRASYPEAHNNLAILLKTAGQREAAHEHYRDALRLWPEYPEAHFNYAIFLENEGDRAAATVHYMQAIKRRPDYTDARLRYANLLAVVGGETEAEQQYQEVLRLRPGYAEAHNNYGVFLEGRNELKAAEQEYLQALGLRPDYAEGSLQLCNTVGE